MTLPDDIDNAVGMVRKDFERGVGIPKYNANIDKIRQRVSQTVSDMQVLYNVVELAIKLLRDFPDEDSQLVNKLETDLMGDYSLAKPFIEAVLKTDYPSSRRYWSFEFEETPIGGIKVVIQLLTDALRYGPKMNEFASLLRSACWAFEVTMGALNRLKPRLRWTVMYPDAFSKDSLRLKKQLMKEGLDNVWQHFQAGLDNYRQGHLSDTANHLSNALTQLVGSIAKLRGYRGGQLGEHTIFLEKIGYIDYGVREMISQFFGLLAKFRKGKEPSFEESRLLVDLAFSLFGYLAPRISSFEVDLEVVKNAKKQTKQYVKERKEKEARRIVAKANGLKDAKDSS